MSSRIENSIIIDHNPSFLWNWDVISSNPALINDAGFAQRHIDKIKIDKAFACFTSETFCSLFSDSYIQEYLDSHPEKMSDATSLASIQLVRNNIDYPWDWTILTARTISCLKIDRLIQNGLTNGTGITCYKNCQQTIFANIWTIILTVGIGIH